MKSIIAAIALGAASFGAQASWLYCKMNPTDCTYIQGKLIPFDKAETIIEDCRALTRNNVGAVAMRMSLDEITKTANNNMNHPLLRAQLAYMALHDSPLEFDRSIPIERRYPLVRLACSQAFADMNR